MSAPEKLVIQIPPRCLTPLRDAGGERDDLHTPPQRERIFPPEATWAPKRKRKTVKH